MVFKDVCSSCCFKVTLVTILSDSLMFVLFVGVQVNMLCCSLITLITVIYQPFLFGLNMINQSIDKYKSTLCTIIANTFMLFININSQMILSDCLIFTLVTVISNSPFFSLVKFLYFLYLMVHCMQI